MGGATFYTTSKGKTAQEAFDAARKEAQYESGHGGYTGTIAEKHRFTMITKLATEAAAMELATKMIDLRDARIDDKWGPAGCIEIEGATPTFFFFGWASC